MIVKVTDKQVTITITLNGLQEVVEQCVFRAMRSEAIEIPKEEKEFIKRVEAAKLLRISLPTLTKFSKTKEQGGLGLLTAHHLGNGTIRYCKQEILKALSEIDKTKHSRRRE